MEGEKNHFLRYCWQLRKGASIKYVRKIFGILDPLPPLSRIHATYQ